MGRQPLADAIAALGLVAARAAAGGSAGLGAVAGADAQKARVALSILSTGADWPLVDGRLVAGLQSLAGGAGAGQLHLVAGLVSGAVGMGVAGCGAGGLCHAQSRVESEAGTRIFCPGLCLGLGPAGGKALAGHYSWRPLAADTGAERGLRPRADARHGARCAGRGDCRHTPVTFGSGALGA